MSDNATKKIRAANQFHKTPKKVRNARHKALMEAISRSKRNSNMALSDRGMINRQRALLRGAMAGIKAGKGR